MEKNWPSEQSKIFNGMPLVKREKFKKFKQNICCNYLLVKPRIFFGLSGKMYIILCILNGNLPFEMHKIIYCFPEKK